jgi:hypothetical protein
MEEKQFTFVHNGVTLTNPNKYIVDQYGNRYMMFTDASGNKFKIRRDDLNIDMATGKCTPRNKVVNVMKA